MLSSEARPRLENFIRTGDLFEDLQHLLGLSLIHISEPTRLGMISYAVFCLKKKKTGRNLESRLLLEKKTGHGDDHNLDQLYAPFS